ncbi:MAG TPA: hypothetical protein VGC14_02520 [Rhizobium sp.]
MSIEENIAAVIGADLGLAITVEQDPALLAVIRCGAAHVTALIEAGEIGIVSQNRDILVFDHACLSVVKRKSPTSSYADRADFHSVTGQGKHPEI